MLLAVIVLCASCGSHALSQNGRSSTIRQFNISNKTGTHLAGKSYILSLRQFKIPVDKCNVIVRVFLAPDKRAVSSTDDPAYVGSYTFGHNCNENISVDVSSQILLNQSSSDWTVTVQLADLKGKPLYMPNAFDELRVALNDTL